MPAPPPTGRRALPRGRRSARAVILGAVLVAVVLLTGTMLSIVGWPRSWALPAGSGQRGLAGPVPTAPIVTATPPAGPTAIPPLQVLGLGDSVTSGYHCNCTDYITGLGKLLAARDHRQVRTDNEGQAGATSADLANELSSDPALRRSVRNADVVVMTIGANDLTDSLSQWRSGGCGASCYQPLIDKMGGRLGQLIGQIQGLRPASPPTVVVTTYWNVFTDGEVAKQAENDGYLDWSDTVTRKANASICAAAGSHGSACVDLYTPFKGDDGSEDPTSLLADDGDHPNAAGTALISRTVLAAIDRPRP